MNEWGIALSSQKNDYFCVFVAVVVLYFCLVASIGGHCPFLSYYNYGE